MTTHEPTIPSKRELIILIAIYAVVFIGLAIKPYDRWDWVLENFFPVSMLLAAVIAYPHHRFTRLSCYLIFFYLLVQTYGGHWTYALAPPFNWLRDEFHLSRNHYDRVAHFMLGFLMAIPIREILLRVIVASRRWMAFLTAAIVLAIGAFYEFIEWWASLLSSPELGNAFLGTQGDIWDSHWDMFLALVGAVLALAIFSEWHEKQLNMPFDRRKMPH